MRIFPDVLAERILAGATRLKPNYETALAIAEERRRLVGRSDSVLVFLFTTLTIIAAYVFGLAKTCDVRVPILGVEVKDARDLVFFLFAIGNVAYVASIGLFLKLFVLENALMHVVIRKDYQDSRVFAGFLLPYHANVFAFLQMNNALENSGRLLQSMVGIARFYSRYFFLFLYAIYYFGVLLTFLIQIADADGARFAFYFWFLICANVMSLLITAPIFAFQFGKYLPEVSRLQHDELT